MAVALGWTYPVSRGPAGTRLDPSAGGGVALVSFEFSLASRRDWLRQVQNCHRCFDAFLPCLGGAAHSEPREVARRLAKVAGHGQLSLRLSAPAPMTPTQELTGRAYLGLARRRRRSASEWGNSVEAYFHQLVCHLSARDARLRRAGRHAAMDLLLPMHREGRLRRDLVRAFDTELSCLLPACSVISSGLWAPLSFAADEEKGDE